MVLPLKPGPQPIGDFVKIAIGWPEIVRLRRKVLMKRGVKRVDLTKPRPN